MDALEGEVEEHGPLARVVGGDDLLGPLGVDGGRVVATALAPARPLAPLALARRRRVVRRNVARSRP